MSNYGFFDEHVDAMERLNSREMCMIRSLLEPAERGKGRCLTAFDF